MSRSLREGRCICRGLYPVGVVGLSGVQSHLELLGSCLSEAAINLLRRESAVPRSAIELMTTSASCVDWHVPITSIDVGYACVPILRHCYIPSPVQITLHANYPPNLMGSFQSVVVIPGIRVANAVRRRAGNRCLSDKKTSL